VKSISTVVFGNVGIIWFRWAIKGPDCFVQGKLTGNSKLPLSHVPIFSEGWNP
jgi:hypothetical protein